MGKIVCRARKSKSCYHGRSEDAIGEHMDEDGTFDGKSVVCTACYIDGGMPALYEGACPTREDKDNQILSGGSVVRHINRIMGIPDASDN